MEKAKLTTPPSGRQTRAKGVLLILAAGVFFTMMNLGVRTGRSAFRADVIVFYRSLIQMALLLPWLPTILASPGTFAQKMRTHFPRGAFGILSMLALYVALQSLPLGLANLLAMTSVLWASLLGRFFLHEHLSRGQLISALIAVTGVAVSLLGADSSATWVWNFTGVASALLCGLFMGLALTILRRMSQTMNSFEIVFFFGLSGVIMTGPYFLAQPQWPTSLGQVGLLLGIGVTASIAQVLMTTGFRFATASIGTISKLLEPIMNLGIGFLFLNEIPPLGFFVGGFLVVCGIGSLVVLAIVYKKNTVAVQRLDTP